MNVIGIDIGGTEIKAGVINQSGEIRYFRKIKTPIENGTNHIMDSLHALIRNIRDECEQEITAIGIGSAGRIDRDLGIVLYATDNLPQWTGTNVKGILEKEHSLPVFVDNDVNVAALGEGWIGASKGIKHYVFISIGTGIGGALVYDHQVVSGHQGGAGEIGHMILHPSGRRCNCGQNGCFEQYASGTSLNRLAKQVDVKWNSRQLISAFEKDDKRAISAMKDFSYELALGLTTIQNIYDPERIILGGGVMETYPLWDSLLKVNLSELSTPKIIPIRAENGNKAGIIGAGLLAMRGVNTKQSKGF